VHSAVDFQCFSTWKLLQVSLHLTCIKDEVARAWPSRLKSCTSPFVSEEVLEVIGSVLRPEDRAPDLRAQIDPVSFQFCLLVSECHRPWWIN